jgi:signal peptidase II
MEGIRPMALSARRLGIGAAVVALLLDQGNKLWLLDVYDIAANQPVRLAPFFDVIFARNPGISYSLFSATTPLGRWTLFAFTIVATAALAAWLWSARTRPTALGLGLIVGGALGNAIDRLAYGYVADFYHFHVGSFSWYIFNVADVAIVGGVVLIAIESLFGRPIASVRPG